ncbi:MAG: LPXTG cell wall anchor domain-containing protein, partial [Clostridiales bacterium]|nr:LPXTG cell wall anchor domain-containing protein [Clostridiales bacterium]
AYTSTLDKDTAIVVTYTATTNGNAISGTDKNEAVLKYGGSSTTTETVTVLNYEVDIIKVDENEVDLDGAEFKLYGSEDGTDEIRLIYVTDINGNYYRPATIEELEDNATVFSDIKAGTARIKGLGNGTYWLKETVAPKGYNALTTRVEVEIDGANRVLVQGEEGLTGGIWIVNETGIVLPSTGGMGTVLFTVIGLAIIAGAGVVLFINRKRVFGK